MAKNTSQLGEYLKQQFLSGQGVVTQGPGAYPKSVVQRLGGPTINKGYDIAVDPNTPINTGGLKYLGAKQDKTGYGLRGAFQDPRTGKTYIFSHLAGIKETPQGVQALTGGIPGVHGRSTGPHLDIDLSGNLSGFSGMLKNIGGRVQQAGQRAFAQSQQAKRRDPRKVLAMAQQKFGKRVRGVASNADKLRDAQRKFGGKIVKL